MRLEHIPKCHNKRANRLSQGASGYTSRDVVINDVPLTSPKAPKWSQVVICDDFHLVTELASHLCICEEMSFFVMDVSLIRDQIVGVMEMNSIYDERHWSWI
jgi:hypothetical protein